MKKVLLSVCFIAASFTGMAQVETPQPSPAAEVEQVVGLTEVEVDYSRPSMKGRTIFGDLVPYNKLWRTGANANTTITFDTDVTVGGKEVKEGTYAVFSIPGEKSWDIMLYSDTNNWGAPREWDESKVVAKVTSEVTKLPFKVESFTIGFGNLTNNGATMDIMWENAMVSMPFEVPTKELATASIEKTMAGPGANAYFSSAVYYLEEGLDLNKAKAWMDKAIEMETANRGEAPYWMLRQKSLIHAGMGDAKGAIAAAKASLAGAEKAGNMDYVALNKKSLKEWGAM
ncbi:DUF2911 domain-containing protein [Robertkochia sediminum]|uniref:DUF2911 domain-containing protein n=1 Tax=Robertkochia sediminum TaxID=2785326 RepID=UPI001934187E|nr:DUF2911 domain-containing protein [Robertkochia sediminum]MBL7473196.1 DUF2911 domain-containing protein [Robertkochia sediminum]